MPYLSLTDDTEIFYQTYGEGGPWITLINGHTRSHSDFRAFSKFLSQQNFRILTFDNRGSGSTKYSTINSFDVFIDDVLALWNHLAITKSHVLGISMGGMIAQKLAAQTQLIQSLVLVSTTSHSKWIFPQEPGWGHTMDDVTEKLNLYFAPQFVEKNKILIQAMAKQIYKAIVDGSFAQGARDQRKVQNNIDLTSSLSHIQCPTLIIHGKNDQIIDCGAASELHAKIKDSQLDLVPNVGHLLLAEYSRKLYERILSFISLF